MSQNDLNLTLRRNILRTLCNFHTDGFSINQSLDISVQLQVDNITWVAVTVAFFTVPPLGLV